jgi:SSS family solute:Na+ symporter
LPVGVAALMLITSLAASVSTSTTAYMGATSTALRDIYSRLIRPEATSKELIKLEYNPFCQVMNQSF